MTPYTTVAEQGNGTFDITWDKATVPDSLEKIQPSGTRQLTFWTRTRTHYQSNFTNTTPVLSRDSVTNNIDTEGFDWVRCAPTTRTAPVAARRSTTTRPTATLDFDVSGSGQGRERPDHRQAGRTTSYPGSGDCNAATYGKNVPTYGPGDYVCWKLRLVFPANLDTRQPGRLRHPAERSSPTCRAAGSPRRNNTVHIGAIDTAARTGRLSWPIGGASERRLLAAGSSRSPSRPPSARRPATTPVTSRATCRSSPTRTRPGKAFTLRDRVDFKLKMPELALVKGSSRSTATRRPAAAPNVDHVKVGGGRHGGLPRRPDQHRQCRRHECPRVGRAPGRDHLRRRRRREHLRQRHLQRRPTTGSSGPASTSPGRSHEDPDLRGRRSGQRQPRPRPSSTGPASSSSPTTATTAPTTS